MRYPPKEEKYWGVREKKGGLTKKRNLQYGGQLCSEGEGILRSHFLFQFSNDDSCFPTDATWFAQICIQQYSNSKNFCVVGRGKARLDY